MDWRYCIICQKPSIEHLQCPASSKRKDTGVGYKSFANNVKEFNSLGILPIDINIELFDEGTGIEQTLIDHKAVWHKYCRDLFSNTKLNRAKKRKVAESSADETGSPVKARRTNIKVVNTKDHCFFCEQSGNQSDLHQAQTLKVDEKVRECAVLLNESKLIAKLSVGDMVALEAKYHTTCLVSLYNRARNQRSVTLKEMNTTNSDLDELAFAQVVAYIDEHLEGGEDVPVFKMNELAQLFSSKLEELEVEHGKVNTSRLRERILTAFPDLTAVSQGRDVVLILKEDIGEMIKRAKEKDSEACNLAKAANIVRRDMLRVKNAFNGTFQENCQKDAIPMSLKILIDMILKGSSVIKKTATDTTDIVPNQASLTIAQLLIFNSISRVRDRKDPSATHHTREKECPLPIYAALKIHGETRDRSLIDAFFKLGMCISYDRVLSISTDIANSVIARYEREAVVCPSKLCKGLFTTAAVDNIDHNPSSITSKDSFHGTAISLVQHPTTNDKGEERSIDTFDPSKRSISKKVDQLPSYYRDVPPVTVPSAGLCAPKISGRIKFFPVVSDRGKEEEKDWLESLNEMLSTEEHNEHGTVSWAAYRALQATQALHLPAIITLLPMFVENSHSLAMIKHSMNVVRAAVHHVNPSQIPVIAFDQPLFALAKQIQWCFPATHGEDHFVVMLGGLHIEMIAYKVLGKWMSGSGWTEVISTADVATQGVTESFISVSHLTRTRRGHQVTAASLHLLQQKAYQKYALTATATDGQELKSFGVWKEEKSKTFPLFLYWDRVLYFEICCLQLVRAFREADFDLYIHALTKIIPWMFALDQTHYARWLSVHLRDMCELSVQHREVFQRFCEGAFVVQKTERLFSSIALDQAHEQLNSEVKGEGGAVGLTENPAALARWMVGGPEVARMTKEFEESTPAPKHQHHEQTPATQAAFAKDVLNVVSSFEDLGNPFSEQSKDLIAVHTRDVADESVIHTVQNIVSIGETQFNTFVQERFIDRSKLISDVIQKNQLPTFSTSSKKVMSKDKEKIGALKDDCALFSRLYIACQSRDGNLEEFFKYENQPWPPSLSHMGQLREGQKADLVKCLKAVATQVTEQPTPDAMILDGAVIVQMLPPGTAQTFEVYCQTVFGPYIARQHQFVKRVDVVWDVYKASSLKKATRERRGTGQRRQVTMSTRIPTDWKGFLRNDENKNELFQLLANFIVTMKIPDNKELYATSGESILSSTNRGDLTNLAPCSHEEADTRLMVHVLDASLCGHHKVMIRTNDTDVVVLAISIAATVPSEELWVTYGTGKCLQNIPVHTIASVLGRERAAVLPMFHALTGCDTVSFFAGRGKKTAWDVWSVFPELTDTLLTLSSLPEKVDDACLAVIERYVVLLYDRTSHLTKVNEARQELFSKKSRTLEKIPPTREALLQHTKRSVYQGGYIWAQTLLTQPALPSPSDWGWQHDAESWTPVWTTLPQMKDTCYELIRCSCKIACTGRCKCVKANLACTGLCNCGGNCN